MDERRQNMNDRVFETGLFLRDYQERVQRKTFTNWMNTYLKKKNMKVENLFEDIKDGVYLLSLLEVLSGEKLQMEREKLKRVHHVSNISTALKFLEMKRIKLVNINVSDIADGKPSIVLGLIWTIILFFQIEDTFAQQDQDPEKPMSELEKFRMNAKKALLAWTGNAITKKYGIEIKDFDKSWRDGLAFNALVHTIRPDLIDFENVWNQSARVNLEQAFSTAEDHLGIPRLLDPEDVDVEKPDEKSVMTYVAQFLKAYPEAGENPANFVEKIKDQQPHSNIQRQQEQGLLEKDKTLKSNRDGVKSGYFKVFESEDAAERQENLSNSVQLRQHFCGEFQDFQECLKTSKRKLHLSKEISDGEISEIQSKLKVLKDEGKTRESKFSQLTQEFNDLIKICSEGEASILKKCYEHLVANYTKLNDLMTDREEVCEKLIYSSDHNNVRQVHFEDELLTSSNQGQHFLECTICENSVIYTCKQCAMNFCTICVVPHMFTKSNNNHYVVKYSELNKAEGGFCLTHPQQKCGDFCETCDIPICLLCVLMQHEAHRTIDLSEKVEELSNLITKDNKHLNTLNSMQSEYENILQQTNERLEALPQVYQQSKDNVTSRAEECHHELDKTEKTLHADLDEMQEKNTILLLTQKEEFEEMTKKLKSLKQSLLAESKDVSFLMQLKLELENLQVPSSVEETRPAYFQPCKLDKNYIATYFGYIETLKSFKISTDDMKIEDPVQPPRQALDVPTVLFTFDTEFPADGNGDRLFSIVSLGDDRVWTGGHNKDLKLFDLQGRLLDTVTISALGYYLTMHKGNIVFSYPGSNTVRIINKREVYTLFDTGKWIPQGIACSAAGNLLVCLHTSDIKESKVVRYSTSGEVLQEIQYDSEYQPLFQKAVYLVENGNSDICVADWGKRALIVVDKYGIFRFSYTGNEASGFHPSSLTTDSMRHIIITSAIQTKIHILDGDGRFLRYIIPDLGLDKPVPVCVVKEGELMVGENKTGMVKRIKYLQ